MLKKWLGWINITLFIVLTVLLAIAWGMEWLRADAIEVKEVTARKTSLPKSSFQQPQKSYDAIGEPVLALTYVAPKMQLPDLRQFIVYYGQNGRPDAQLDKPSLHFSLANSRDVISLGAGEKLYLQYQKDNGQGKYVFSPENRETSLWIEAEPEEGEAVVQVRMKDENGNLVATPETLAQFPLKEKELMRFGGGTWELGKWRVDGTLLARQRARWYGPDMFLKRHGGDEFKDVSGKQRIDFGEKGDTYSVYVGQGDSLIWDGSKWTAVEPSEQSRGHPLLIVKKVDDRLMNLELWDNEGKKKVALNLLRSMESWSPASVQQDFRFVGVRTRSQFVFEVDDERMLLRPHDWLLLTENGWHKLTSIDEIDDYVDRRENGTLFVFDGVVKRDDQQVLSGTIFNPTRTVAHDVELPVSQNGMTFHDVDPKRRSRDASSFVNGKSRSTPVDVDE
ncbi:MAG: hypothetical protein KDK72_01050 [Chlamydiia bacterium]|nr:hypothetical protein [Chlamydiia bacterium]